MLRHVFMSLLFLSPVSAVADTVLAAVPIRAGAVLSLDDVLLDEQDVPGAIDDLREAVGLQAVRNLYPGRPIIASDLQRPHLVTRNQAVTIHFRNNLLTIVTDGRALDGGAPGDIIRVLNASSRNVVMGTVQSDGTVSVTGSM